MALLNGIQDMQRVRLDVTGGPEYRIWYVQNSSVSKNKEAPTPAGGTGRKSPFGGNDQFISIVHSV